MVAHAHERQRQRSLDALVVEYNPFHYFQTQGPQGLSRWKRVGEGAIRALKTRVNP